MQRIGAISRLTLDIILTGLHHLPETGEEIQAKAMQLSLGGGPLVTPVLLGRMGMPVKFATFLDDSTEARFAETLLKAQGCSDYTNFFQGGQPPVTVSIVMPKDNDRSIISYEAPLTMPSAEQMFSFFQDCDVMLMPKQPDLAMKLKHNGTAIVLDTTDFDAPPSRAYLSLLEIITPNRREASAITGKTTPEGALLELVSAGVRHPLIKLGAAGCMILYNGAPCIVPPAGPACSVDSTGAGDNFLAGLLYGFARGWRFIDCVRMANVFGGLSTTATGVFGANITEQSAHRLYFHCYGELPKERDTACGI